LAYALGVGVDTNAFDAGPLDSSHLDVLAPESGAPVRSAVGPTPLLVSRQPDGVKVIADRCSHRGAPLSEGEISPGGCVTCPWHGSQ
jgi:nitrite reductase/ring-hydroxylating ferredoxin subunit